MHDSSEVIDMKLENVNMSIPTYMALKGHDINDTNELVLQKPEEIQSWNIERKTLQEIIGIMHEYGSNLEEGVVDWINLTD